MRHRGVSKPSGSGARRRNRARRLLAWVAFRGGVGWDPAVVSIPNKYRNTLQYRGGKGKSRSGRPAPPRAHGVVGYRVTAASTADADAFRRRPAVSPYRWAYRAAIVASYIVDGHVPVNMMDRAWREQPDTRSPGVAGHPAARAR